MLNVALFDIFTLLFYLIYLYLKIYIFRFYQSLLLLYISLFIFNIRSFLLHIFHVHSIFYHLYFIIFITILSFFISIMYSMFGHLYLLTSYYYFISLYFYFIQAHIYIQYRFHFYSIRLTYLYCILCLFTFLQAISLAKLSRSSSYGTREGTFLFQYLPEKKSKQKELERKSKQYITFKRLLTFPFNIISERN